MDECAFCGTTSELRNSHVLPAFVFRWLKGRATGHIRNTDNPNVRVQDGEKKPWLCGACEQMFGQFERDFATKLFHPWLNGQLSIRYTEWLLKFCVSVSWRVLKHCKGKNPNKVYTVEENELSQNAADTWHDFLVGKIRHPAQFEQHLVIFDTIEDTTIDDLPTNINRFLVGAVTMDIVGSNRTMMTFAKLGRFCIFGFIKANKREWEGTKVHVHQGIIKPGKYVLPYGLMALIREKAELYESAMEKLTPNQRKKIDNSVQDNLDIFANSDHFAAMLADARMFGDSVIISKPVGSDNQ